MNTIPAEDIKRRGVSALDELLKNGAAHVIKNNRPPSIETSDPFHARLTARLPRLVRRII